MKQCRLGLIAFLLISMLACVIPGLEAPIPSPVDPNMIPTIVVATANAAATQTAVAGPLATETPAEVSVPKLTGITLEQLKDGSTKYTDQDAGFEVTFPAGWLALRPNSEEFNASLANAGAHNSVLHEQMTSDQAGYNASIDRVYSYILRPDIEKNFLFGFSKLAWDSKDATRLDNATLGEMVQSLEASQEIPGFRADTAQVRENGNAVMTIEIGGRFALSDGQGGTVPFYGTVVFFKPTPSSLARLTITYLLDYKAKISTEVKSIIESIKVVGLQPN
jgi:hypothetical protein